MKIEVRLEEERVIVLVIDHGPGIKPEDEEKIFEPFVRGTRSDDEGTGLGLSIARGLARAFGGDVTTERATGGRFVIELPRWHRRDSSPHRTAP